MTAHLCVGENVATSNRIHPRRGEGGGGGGGGGGTGRGKAALRRKDGDVGSSVWHETCWGGRKARVVFTFETFAL